MCVNRKHRKVRVVMWIVSGRRWTSRSRACCYIPPPYHSASTTNTARYHIAQPSDVLQYSVWEASGMLIWHDLSDITFFLALDLSLNLFDLNDVSAVYSVPVEGAIVFLELTFSLSLSLSRATCSCCPQIMRGQNGGRAFRNCRRKVRQLFLLKHQIILPYHIIITKWHKPSFLNQPHTTTTSNAL